MDVIGDHLSRLPQLDERWVPGQYSRQQLEEALLDGQVAGWASHPADNVTGNIRMLIEQDPDKLFGLSGMPGDFNFEEIVGLVEDASGGEVDLSLRHSGVMIEPGPIIDQCVYAGEHLAKACRDGRSMVLATGHPVGLALFYTALGELLKENGARIITPADGVSWNQDGLHHPWTIAYMNDVAVITDDHQPRHTHQPDPMQRIIAEQRPDLVVADHGFAGAAIEAGVDTVSIADVNDPALIVARAQGRTRIVIVMDDHVDPSDYWPCFQAIAAQF